MRRLALLGALLTPILHSVAVAQVLPPPQALQPPHLLRLGEDYGAIAQEYDKTRTIHGHAFLQFNSVPWPFVTTRVGSITGVGHTKLKSVPFLGLRVLGDNPRLVTLSQVLEADFLLVRWLALSTALSGANAVGVNDSGALNLGINYAAGGRLGLVLRLLRRANWYLSLRADWAGARAEAVLPVNLINTVRVVDGRTQFNVGALTQSGKFHRGTLPLMLAASPASWFGLQSALAFEVLRTEVGARSTRNEFAIAALGSSFRLDGLGLPVAFLLGGNMRFRLNDDSRRVFFSTLEPGARVGGQIETGVFYSDPKYVDVGASAVFEMAKNDQRQRVQLVLNHFW